VRCVRDRARGVANSRRRLYPGRCALSNIRESGRLVSAFGIACLLAFCLNQPARGRTLAEAGSRDCRRNAAAIEAPGRTPYDRTQIKVANEGQDDRDRQSTEGESVEGHAHVGPRLVQKECAGDRDARGELSVEVRVRVDTQETEFRSTTWLLPGVSSHLRDSFAFSGRPAAGPTSTEGCRLRRVHGSCIRSTRTRLLLSHEVPRR